MLSSLANYKFECLLCGGSRYYTGTQLFIPDASSIARMLSLNRDHKIASSQLAQWVLCDYHKECLRLSALCENWRLDFPQFVDDRSNQLESLEENVEDTRALHIHNGLNDYKRACLQVARSAQDLVSRRESWTVNPRLARPHPLSPRRK